MANNSRINPMYVDTTGSLIGVGTRVSINGILVLPSNATWAITIKDGAGNYKFFADNVGANGAMPPCVPFWSEGLQVTTLTNCTALIFTNPS